MNKLFTLLLALAIAGPATVRAWENADFFTLVQENACPGCDLGGAPLQARDFAGAKLGGANLAGADLRFANLAGADLRGTALGGANLTAANLIDARIDGASLSDAIFCQTVMPEGNRRNDECLEGIWREESGGVVEVRRVSGGGYEVVLRGGGTQPAGTVVMRGLTRISPGHYAGEQYASMDGSIFWVNTDCRIDGPAMSCFDGMLSFSLDQATPNRPAEARPARTFEYTPADPIGAPTNREGVGSR